MCGGARAPAEMVADATSKGGGGDGTSRGTRWPGEACGG
jgi:hypothetical protein